MNNMKITILISFCLIFSACKNHPPPSIGENMREYKNRSDFNIELVETNITYNKYRYYNPATDGPVYITTDTKDNIIAVWKR